MVQASASGSGSGLGSVSALRLASQMATPSQ
jgi:hypothetical protein